jgi:hypothetical protein
MLVTITLLASLGFVAGPGPMHHIGALRPELSLQALARTDSVTVVLVEELSRPGFAAEVRRGGRGAKRTVIVLKRSALSPRLVAAAFVADARARRRVGPDARVTSSISEQMVLRPVAPPDRARMEAIVRRLLSAAPVDVPGVGRGPAVVVAADTAS